MARATKGERRERKKRRRMPVSGRHVFTLQQLMAKPKPRKPRRSKA
ncbi:MAG: hypothetical protein U0514_00335 [Candidatus Andersenbacteria bacterium]